MQTCLQWMYYNHCVCLFFVLYYYSHQERQASVLKHNALYSKLQPTSADDEEEYQKLEHHKRDSKLSVNQYDTIDTTYAKDGPSETDAAYEYVKINSKSKWFI